MNKFQIGRLAVLASEQLQKCKWWQWKRKKVLEQIIFEAYLDITR